MAREIKQLIWCDLCNEIDGVQTEGEEMPAIIIGRKKPRVLAVCKPHQVDFWDKFVEVLETAGVPVDDLENPGRPTRSSANKPRTMGDQGTSSTGKRIVCPLVDDCGTKPLKNVSSVASHLRNKHGMNLFEAVGKDGQLFDVDGTAVDMPEVRAARQEPEVKRAECQEPGCETVYEWPTHQKPIQALGVHMAKTHGIPGAGKAKKAASAA